MQHVLAIYPRTTYIPDDTSCHVVQHPNDLSFRLSQAAATQDFVSLSLKLPFLGQPQSIDESDERGATNNDSSIAGCYRNSRSGQSPQPERNFFTALVNAGAKCYIGPHGLF